MFKPFFSLSRGLVGVDVSEEDWDGEVGEELLLMMEFKDDVEVLKLIPSPLDSIGGPSLEGFGLVARGALVVNRIFEFLERRGA